MTLRDFKNAKDRRQYLEKKLNIKLENIKKALLHDEKEITVENLIGETTLPLGVAGPIKIQKSKFKSQNYYIPLATTEGALVASVNRGCKAVNQSGGVKVFFEKIGTTRGPVYETKNLEKGFWFLDWLKKNENLIKKTAEKTSSYLKYLKFDGKVIGPYTFVRFYFETNKAMGMNMVTFATDEINKVIEEKTGISCLALSGNYCIDKKPSWLNFILGRGISLWAEAIIKKEVVEEVLKTTPQKIFDVWLAKNITGSIISGSLGFNAHFANIVAAFFSATGQDLAHVVEGSMGITATKLEDNGDLYFSIYLPSVIIGVVGGGTNLAIKKEAIKITQAETKEELAEVLAGAVLAGELSLLASLAEGSLAKAHKKLGRIKNKK
jgi:hydroxymethylglutaryl-CoA reductase (NADPH)